MNFDIDESKILYGLGAFLGVISIIYFGHELILDLSPTIKSFILLGSTIIFLVSGELVENNLLRTSLYIFSGFSYLSFLTYFFARFSPSRAETFLILAGSSAAFITLGYLRSEDIYSLEPKQSKMVIIAVSALIILTVAFDAAGSQPEYNLELEESVSVVEGEEFSVGSLEVRNDFPLSRNIDVPRFNGCIATSKEEPQGLYISPDSEDIIRGSETLSFNLTEKINSRRNQNTSISGEYNIRNQECPNNLENNTIYIHQGEDSIEIRD